MGSAAECMDGMCRRMSTAVTAGYHRLKDDDASKDKPRDRPGARAEGDGKEDEKDDHALSRLRTGDFVVDDIERFTREKMTKRDNEHAKPWMLQEKVPGAEKVPGFSVFSLAYSPDNTLLASAMGCRVLLHTTVRTLARSRLPLHLHLRLPLRLHLRLHLRLIFL